MTTTEGDTITGATTEKFVPPHDIGTRVRATRAADSLVAPGTTGVITWTHPWPEMPYRVQWELPDEERPAMDFGMSDIGWLTKPEEIEVLGGPEPTEHRIRDGVAECLGGPYSACHIYPDCECEYWQVDENTGRHEHPVQANNECWVVPWINSTDLRDSATDAAEERRDPETGAWPDGRISYEWEGEYVIWSYDDEDASNA